MVRVIGNSTERVRIADLSDVIYYRQQKDYTDQEFEESKDLRKAIQKGQILKVEGQSYRPSAGMSDQPVVENRIDIREIKQAVREVQEEASSRAQEVKDAVREAIPLLVQVVREEMKNIQVTAGTEPKTTKAPRVDPEYIPMVSTEGMKASIKAESREMSGESVDSSLEALRKLRNK